MLLEAQSVFLGQRMSKHIHWILGIVVRRTHTSSPCYLPLKLWHVPICYGSRREPPRREVVPDRRQRLSTREDQNSRLIRNLVLGSVDEVVSLSTVMAAFHPGATHIIMIATMNSAINS